MLRALAQQVSTRSVWWLHDTRNGEQDPFAREVLKLLRALPDSRRVVAYSHALSTDRRGVDFDVAGRLDVNSLRELEVPHDGDFYLCGPDSFMHDFNDGLAAWSVSPDRIRVERFGPGQSFMPGVIDPPVGPAHPPLGPPGAGPLVSFARSGITVRWDDHYASLIELAEACNVPVRYACRTGVCHTCISRLMAGSVAYDPEPLERPAQDNVLICCSRPTGEVTLDV